MKLFISPLLLLCFVFTLILLSCSAGGGNRSKKCEPGDIKTCPCVGGEQGVQTCTSDRSWGVCEGCPQSEVIEDPTTDEIEDSTADVAKDSVPDTIEDPVHDVTEDPIPDTIIDRVCVPGSTQECLCIGGHQGVQICSSDGLIWGVCEGCPQSDVIEDPSPDVIERVCDPGSTQECVCIRGYEGVQICTSDGLAWGICEGCFQPDVIEDPSPDVIEQVCDPGSILECVCIGGGQGVQICTSDGLAWGVCEGCSLFDVTEDTDTTDGECNNDVDREIIENTDMIGEASNCGMGCLGSSDPEICSVTCLSEATGISEPCAWCYAESITCTIDNCLMSCAMDPESEECRICQEDSNCINDFYQCAGVMP